MSSPFDPDPILVDQVADLISGRIETEPWDCDIRAILSPLIDRHQQELGANGEPREPGFEDYPADAKPLSMLIGEDVDYLSTVHGLLAQAPPLSIVEAFSPDVNAQLIRAEVDGKARNLAVFHTPVIYLINSFFSKLDILNASDVYAGCMDEHRPLMEGDDYDDLNLIAAIYRDMEVMVDRSFVRKPLEPPFLGSPFDLCERVEGARRFVVAHEISHSFVDHPFAQDTMNTFRTNLTGSMGEVLSPRQIEHWAEELWCDESAVAALNFLYKDELDDPATLHRATNALQGVITFFFMLYLLEIGFKRDLKVLFGAHFPPVELRYKAVRESIKGSHLFQNQHISSLIERYHRRMGTVHQTLGGAGFSPKHGNLVLAIQPLLNDFSREFYRAVFEQIRFEDSPWSIKRGGF